MKRRSKSFRALIQYKVKLSRQNHSQLKLRLQDRASIQLRKAEGEVSLLVEIQTVLLLQDLVRKRPLQSQRFVRVTVMPNHLHNQLLVSNKSKDQFQ